MLVTLFHDEIAGMNTGFLMILLKKWPHLDPIYSERVKDNPSIYLYTLVQRYDSKTLLSLNWIRLMNSWKTWPVVTGHLVMIQNTYFRVWINSIVYDTVYGGGAVVVGSVGGSVGASVGDAVVDISQFRPVHGSWQPVQM